MVRLVAPVTIFFGIIKRENSVIRLSLLNIMFIKDTILKIDTFNFIVYYAANYIAYYGTYYMHTVSFS